MTSSERERPSYRTTIELVRVAGLLRKGADRFFQRYGITQSQFNLLIVLRYDMPEGCSQTEISRRLLVQGANTTALVRRLLAQGLISRKLDPDDERARIVKLTAKGRKLLVKVESTYYAKVDDVMRGVSARDLAKFESLLEKTHRNIESLEDVW